MPVQEVVKKKVTVSGSRAVRGEVGKLFCANCILNVESDEMEKGSAMTVADQIRERLVEDAKLADVVNAAALAATRYAATICDVLDLHGSREAQRHFGDRRLVCAACDDGRSTPAYPCRTVEAIAAALGVSGADGVRKEGRP